jgi:hypothetical protein
MNNTKKILLVSLIVSGFAWVALPASAARLVPNLSPLQPIPMDTAPSVSQNINSKDSEVNKNLQQEQQQIKTGGQTDLNPQDTKTEEVTSTKSSTPGEPTKSVAYYFILLVLGIIGLFISGLLIYRRFWSR